MRLAPVSSLWRPCPPCGACVLPDLLAAALEYYRERGLLDNSPLDLSRSFYLFRRSLYEEGTPQCRFRRKPEALGARRIRLYVWGVILYAFRIEPMHSYFDRNAQVVELWDYLLYNAAFNFGYRYILSIKTLNP
jgi:hypothetical protein